MLVIAAPGGYGKTSALAQALHEPDGLGVTIDLWLQCDVSDADPTTLATSILGSAGLDREITRTADAAPQVVDALARYAPAHVCLVLDDVHRIPDDAPAIEFLDDLLAALPRNAHVVLSGRKVPAIRLARHDLHGMVEHIGVADLEFDDAELAAAVGDTTLAFDDAARWPALASLTQRTTLAGPMEFLLEEVAGGLEQERVVALRALAHLTEITDDVARAASAGRWSAAALLDGLPLVQRDRAGAFQLHDLWRQSLTGPGRDDPTPALVAALERVATLRLEDGATIEAARLFAAARLTDGVAAAVASLASEPLLLSSSADLRAMLDIARSALGEHLLTSLLETSVTVTGNERTTAEGYERIARLAADAGDDLVELLALQNALNMRTILDPDAIPPWIGERSAELASRGVPSAHSIAVIVAAHATRAAGEPERSAAILTELLPPPTASEAVSYAFGMNDIGRPEQVATPTDLAAAVTAGGQYVAAAMWLTGVAPPDVALALGASLGTATEEAGFAHVQVPTNSVLALIALAADEVVAARRYTDAALRRSADTASVHVRAFAHLAEAMCVLCERGEDEAREHVARLVAELPLGTWPARPYLYALPAVYFLAPSTREAYDRCRFGPSLSAAQAAARALVALVERGDPLPARDLAWDRPWLLRAHVLPRHLALLAAAAGASGHGGIDGVLSDLPRCREYLTAASALDHPATVEWARARVAAMPARPAFDLRVELLGPMRLYRGDTAVEDAAWVKRERVRQLLAFLVMQRRASRRRIAETLWSHLPTAAALDNLRVNLTHLQRVLQPQRARDEPPWFVRSDGEVLELVMNGLHVDAVEFDATCRSAREFDDRGRSTEAIAMYRRAVELHRGDFLDDWPDEDWTAAERLRLQVLEIGARCRLGELLLARGEPEEAAQHAAAALRAEPLHERAARLLAHTSIAQAHRAGAQRVLATLARGLRDHQLRPEPETEALARSLGVDLTA